MSVPRQVAKHVTSGMLYGPSHKALAEKLRGPKHEVPRSGDYVRITNMHDGDFGQIAVVLWVDQAGAMDLSTVSVHIMLHPFGGGVRLNRPVGPQNVKILNEMEVLAEASK